MGCKYYLNGRVSQLFTDLYGYIDTVEPSKRTARKLYEILRDNNLVALDSGSMYVKQGYDFREQAPRLRKLDIIQQKYPGLVTYEFVKKTPPTGYTMANRLHVVTINESMLQSEEDVPALGARYADVEIESTKDLEEYLADEGTKPKEVKDPDTVLSEMALKENTSQSRFSEMPDSDRQTAEQQSKRLQNTFAKVGIDVVVKFDSSLDAKGELQGKEPGKPLVIKLNPNRVSEDTAFHEFGHIYIDLLGNSPEVAKAIEELKGTTLYKKVELQYPELAGEKLDKEVLATAIGLEGAKIVRKNPSKLQILLNKIFRAFSKMLNSFGIGSTPSTAAKLAQDMFAENMNPAKFIGGLSSYAQKSKGEEKIDSILTEIKLKTQNEINEVQSRPEYTEEQQDLKQDDLNRLKVLKATLENVTKVEQFGAFIEYTGLHLEKMQNEYDSIIEEVENNPDTAKDPKTAIRLYALRRGMDAMDVMRALSSKIVDKKLDKATEDSVVNKLENLDQRVDAILKQLNRLDSEFEKNIIPIMADAMLPFANQRVEEDLKAQIENLKKTGRVQNKLDTADVAYKELKDSFDNGILTEEQFNDDLLELVEQQIRNKMITGRSDIIRMLKSSYKDKSRFSAMMDPLMYSNERTVQLLTKIIDDANQNKNAKTLDLKYDIKEAYEKFAAGQNENNVEKLFAPLQETITVNVKNETTGKYEKTKVLSLVQPLDNEKWKAAEKELKERLKKVHKMPLRENFKNPQEYQNAYDNWKGSALKQAYDKGISDWLDKHTEPVEGYLKVLKKYEKAIKAQEKIIEIAKKAGNTTQEGEAVKIKESLEAQKARDFNATTGKPQGNLVKPSQALYENPRWTAIQNDPRLKEFYDFYLETYKDKQKMIGRNRMFRNNWETFSYVLPSIRKDGIDKISEDGIIKAGKDLLVDTFSIQATDDEFAKYDDITGEVRKRVPVFYTSPVEKSIVSKDMISSLYRFSHMAHNFLEKSEIAGQVELIREIMEDRIVDAKDASGRRVVNFLGEKIGKRVFRKQPGESNRVNHIKEFIDTHMYGEKEVQKTISTFLGDINLNKAASALNSYTAITNLAFNALQIGNQAVLDNMTSIQEAYAGQFFSKSDMRWAAGEYFTAQKAALKDVGKFAPDTKLGKAIEFFDSMTEITDQEGNKIIGGKARKGLSFDNLMFGQHAVEHQTASVRMLAVLRATKVKDKDGNPILNKEGKEANLWEMLIIDDKGRMSIDPRVANANRKDVTLLLRGLSRRVNQTKGSFDSPMFARTWYGKMIVLFRNYLVPGLRRRYGHGEKLHVDEELGTVTQGMYVTFLGMMKEAYEKKTVNLGGIYADMTPMERENVKRVAVELSSTIAAMAIVAALSAIDDDEESHVNDFLLYQARRYQTEMLQWNPVFGAKDILRMIESPAATVRPIEQGMELFNQLRLELFHLVGMPFVEEKDIFYQRGTGRFEKGDRKIRKYFEDMFPVVRGIQKSANADDALKWFNK